MNEKESYQVFKRDHFTCQYCGFDGRLFDNWRQLTLDHVKPRSCDGEDSIENQKVACPSCNLLTSQMKFEKHEEFEDIFRKKCEKVKKSRKDQYSKWLSIVAPYYLDKG